jgi:hypothetical protein
VRIRDYYYLVPDSHFLIPVESDGNEQAQSKALTNTQAVGGGAGQTKSIMTHVEQDLLIAISWRNLVMVLK